MSESIALPATTPEKTGRAPYVSLVPLVAAGIAAFWLVHAMRLHEAQMLPTASFDALLVWLIGMGLWGVVTSWLSLSGRYRQPHFLALLPGLWLPPLPVLATAMALAAFPALRDAFLALANGISGDQFMLVQMLRIAAIGGLTKTILGRLPPAFGFGTGIPDLLFGLSAAALLWTGAYASLAPATMIAWNIFGALVFMIAPLILQLTLPGPLQVFKRAPDGRELMDFPMVLAPTLLGPLLLIANFLHAAKLYLTP